MTQRQKQDSSLKNDVEFIGRDINHWAALCEIDGSRGSGRHGIPNGAIPFRVGFSKVEDIRIEDLRKGDLANEGIDVKKRRRGQAGKRRVVQSEP